MPVTIIEHRGKILYTDFSNIKDAKVLMDTMYESDRMYQEYGDNVRHMLNFHNAMTSPEFFEKSKELGKKTCTNA